MKKKENVPYDMCDQAKPDQSVLTVYYKTVLVTQNLCDYGSDFVGEQFMKSKQKLR